MLSGATWDTTAILAVFHVSVMSMVPRVRCVRSVVDSVLANQTTTDSTVTSVLMATMSSHSAHVSITQLIFSLCAGLSWLLVSTLNHCMSSLLLLLHDLHSANFEDRVRVESSSSIDC